MMSDFQLEPAVSSPSHDFAQWFGVLGAPIAWAVHFQIAYALTERACRTSSAAVIHMVTACCLLTCVVALFVAAFSMSGSDSSDPEFEASISRPRFMAMLGVLVSIMFFLVIVAQLIASVMVVPCAD